VTETRSIGKLGALAPKRPQGLHMLAYYQANPFPAAPENVAVPTVSDWQILGNDKYGDCTFAGIVHSRMANAAVLGITENFPSESDVVNAYLSYTKGADAGAVEAELLSYWKDNNLFGSKVAAFAPTDRYDLDELKSVIANLGLAYIGVALPSPAETQFADHQPWQLTASPADDQIIGGHCIVLVGYDKDFVYAVTWGTIQAITWVWLQKYMTESWAIITPEIVEKGQYGNLRLTDLLADIEKLS